MAIPDAAPRPPRLNPVTWAAVWNEALWTAGYSLTSGSFLVYFGSELGATAFLIAVLLAIPETAGIVGLATRWIIQHVDNRRKIWLNCSLAARLVSLGIPLLAFPRFRPQGIDSLWVLIVFVAVSHALQSIAFVSYLSWLADLVPENRWGRFFAVRNVAKVCILLVVPVSAGFLRDWWRRTAPPEAALWVYVAAFAVGLTLQLLSLVPMLKFANIPVRLGSLPVPEWGMVAQAFRQHSLRFLLIHSWWLAAANGVTQSAFFGFSVKQLHVGLGMYNVLTNVMNAVMIPVSILAGAVSDRRGNKWLLFWGVVTASSGLIFWLAATPEQRWWLFGAYVVWGAFAAANIAGQNLLLKLSPRSDNSAQLALFRQVGGLLAGTSGLLGGLWLQSLLESGYTAQLGSLRLDAYRLIFLVSLIARWASVVWILPIREPAGSMSIPPEPAEPQVSPEAA